MKRAVTAILLCSILLSGCGYMDGSYVSVKPHQQPVQVNYQAAISATNYLELFDALVDLVAVGTESATINVSRYPAKAVDSGMAVAMRYVQENDPIGAYAVESINYEVGSSGGRPAVAVQITYLHNRSEIRSIRTVADMNEAQTAIERALENCESSLVLLVESYSKRDIAQIVQDFAEENPHLVMEVPQVAVGEYGTGSRRVLELSFSYLTGRSDLRQMKQQVKPVFDAAVLYVSSDASQWQKYSQLYGFLMERFDYTVETSITPAYSLLHHGVGDSKAFATVYAAMCRAAGLECQIVKGTCSGEPWTWNMVCDNGYHYHVDLLNSQGRFQERTDYQMQGYVWDYSGFPACTGVTTDQPDEEDAHASSDQPDTQPQEETVPPVQDENSLE